MRHGVLGAAGVVMLLAFLAASGVAASGVVRAAQGSGDRDAADRGPADRGPAGPRITGFRDALFGMTEAQVRSTVVKTLGMPAASFMEGENNVQHTKWLAVPAPGLVSGGGTALVTYIFGYQRQRLTQVNILWSAQTDAGLNARRIYQDGATLQQYFAGEGFAPARSGGNIVTQTGIVLFRARDVAGHAVVLMLGGAFATPATGKRVFTPQALTLSYVDDPAHPDVLVLKPGSF